MAEVNTGAVAAKLQAALEAQGRVQQAARDAAQAARDNRPGAPAKSSSPEAPK